MGKDKKERKKKAKHSTANLKGHDFEKKVAKWAEKYFNAKVVKTNIYRRGYTQVKHAYEIDVYVKRKGFLGLTEGSDIWIECKTLNTNINRNVVINLIGKMDDVNKACEMGISKEDIDFEHGVIVSTSPFDIGALGYASDKDIACFQHEKRKYVLKNTVSWLE